MSKQPTNRQLLRFIVEVLTDEEVKALLEHVCANGALQKELSRIGVADGHFPEEGVKAGAYGGPSMC